MRVRRTSAWWIAAAMTAGCGSGAETTDASDQTVLLQTSMGDVIISLSPDRAPASVESFLAYVDAGFYDGLVFHRVIPGFMIQAGGHGPDLAPREASGDPIRNEGDNGLSNLRGTVALARTSDPHSARAQFFINVADNTFLDHEAQGPGAWGYAVFGRVVEGMDVVDAIAAVPTRQVGPMGDVPVEAVLVETARRQDR